MSNIHRGRVFSDDEMRALARFAIRAEDRHGENANDPACVRRHEEIVRGAFAHTRVRCNVDGWILAAADLLIETRESA